MNPDWHKNEPKRSWVVCKEANFTVEVVAWSRGGEWKWNVYAYVFGEHSSFLNPESLTSAPFHGGCNYLRRINDSSLTNYGFPMESEYVKAGCDYAHLYDERFGVSDPKDGIPAEIINDANELAKWLKDGSK